MNSLNLKPFQGQMDQMALKLAVILVVPLIVGLFLKWSFRVLIRLPIGIANFIAILGFLFAFYEMIGYVLV